MQNCPRCDEIFSGNSNYCPKCSMELTFPIEQKETPDLVVLCTVLDESKAHIMRGFLESEGIPCQLENISFHAEPAPVADLMKVRLWVLREDFEQGHRLLKERENVQVCSACSIEVGEQDETCPHCGEKFDDG